MGDAFAIGGAKGIRTPDPLHAMQVRYQLRHSPKLCQPKKATQLDYYTWPGALE